MLRKLIAAVVKFCETDPKKFMRHTLETDLNFNQAHIKFLERVKSLFWLHPARRDRYENICLYWAERRVSATLTKHGFENGIT